MYKSPIDILYGQMRMQIENDVVKAVMDVGINVDKEELTRALQYDRGQYEKGYQDAVHGKDLVEVVRCKDCKYWIRFCDTYGATKIGNCFCNDTKMCENDFCSYGERKDNG